MCRTHPSLLAEDAVQGWLRNSVCLCTGSLDRVCQDPLGGVVLGVVDEAVFDERQIDPWEKKKKKTDKKR